MCGDTNQMGSQLGRDLTMGYSAKILKDSISYEDHRITTFEVTLPRIVLAEFNTQVTDPSATP